jgi:hypothetical protein
VLFVAGAALVEQHWKTDVGKPSHCCFLSGRILPTFQTLGTAKPTVLKLVTTHSKKLFRKEQTNMW